MKCLLLYFFQEQPWREMSDATRTDALTRLQQWQDQPEQVQRILSSGELRGVDEARTVYLGPAGQTEHPEVTAGSYTHAPEALGGYSVIEVTDLEEAVTLVKTFPTGGIFEIRPIVEQ
jgi:hypothetical protein